MRPDRRRPNVLFIITDQQRADHVGYAGNEVVATPNLDRLAARGTVFDEAWVANPICMPNRSSLMTGRMPTSHGVVFNDRSLDWGANTFVRTFRSCGWRTALIGKSHLQHGMSRNSVFHAEVEPVATTSWPDGWDTLEHAERYTDEPPEFPDSFYGFEHVELSIDHGARVSGHHLQWALERGGRYEDLAVPLDATSPSRHRSPRWWQVYQPPYEPELHSTTFVADRTTEFIERSSRAGEPWLAWASFPDPHHPMTPPGDYFFRHRPGDMPLPATIDDPLEHAPRHIQRIRRNTVAHQRGWVGAFGVHDPELLGEAIAATYGTIEMIDDAIGRIVEAVDRIGQTQDTIVVFTSDHGDMMGDHGLMLKGFMHYQGTLRVPLVIVDPSRPAGRTSSLASSVDVAPTLLDLAGLPEYFGMQGSSLLPVLDDPQESVRDHVLIEDDAPHGLVAAGLPAKTRTIVSDGFKYTRISTRESQLFDLTSDPDELIDLADRHPTLRASMTERLADAMLTTADDARGAPAVPA